MLFLGWSSGNAATRWNERLVVVFEICNCDMPTTRILTGINMGKTSNTGGMATAMIGWVKGHVMFGEMVGLSIASECYATNCAIAPQFRLVLDPFVTKWFLLCRNGITDFV